MEADQIVSEDCKGLCVGWEGEQSGEKEIEWRFLDFTIVLQHKYQINIDGTVAAYRLPYLLVGDSVVLKQDSIYYEHFYNELQPWKHYIPVKSNLSDLLEKLKWAKDHDEEVRLVSLKVYFHLFPNIMGPFEMQCTWRASRMFT